MTSIRALALPLCRPAARLSALLACLLAMAAPVVAAEPPAEEVDPPAATATEDYGQPRGPADPHNRGTPRGSVYGFTQAAEAGDYERAAEYLDLRRLPPSQQQRGPMLARQLKLVLDRTVALDFKAMSDTNEGAPDDGLPAWRDRLARIETAEGPVDLLLQRVPREGDGVRIWKIASVTVEQTPTLHAEFGYGPLERWLPTAFFDFRFLEVQLWQWLALLVLLSLAWLASLVLSSTLTRLLHRLSSRTETTLDDRIVLLARGPLRLTLGVGLFAAGHALLGLSLGAHQWLRGLEQVAIILAAAWAVMRFTDLAALALRERLVRRGQSDTLPIVQPSQRAVKVVFAGFALLAILNSLGINVTAVVAGLGVGGIAVALAAQKTIENLFGGVTLFADQPVRVGDFCRFGDMVGTVEEIGLRSTRIRTLDRTLVSIPNAEFSQLHLENFAKRDRIRLHTMIGVRYETTSDQLRYLLAQLREMLLAHPKISPDPARVRLVAFGAYSIDLELFAYARTADWNEFLAIREDIYLRMMDIVGEAGTGFAFPSSTTYIGRDDGLDEKRSQRAAERVEAWRVEGKLPFPNFTDDFHRGVEDTLDWPPAGSPGQPRAGDAGRRPRVGTDEA